MISLVRPLPRAALRAARLRAPIPSRSFAHLRPLLAAAPPQPPRAPNADSKPSSVVLGTAKRLPEFNLEGKIVLVSGAGRGLGLVQAEALLEAGATGLFTRTVLEIETAVSR
jgi:hypothetical protein